MSEFVFMMARGAIPVTLAAGLLMPSCDRSIEIDAPTQEQVPATEQTVSSEVIEKFIPPQELRYPISEETRCSVATVPEGCVETLVPDSLTLAVPKSLITNSDQIAKAVENAQSHMIQSSAITVSAEIVIVPEIDPATHGTNDGQVCINGIEAARAAAKSIGGESVFWAVLTDAPLCPSALPNGAAGEASIWEDERYLAVDGTFFEKPEYAEQSTDITSDLLWHEIKHLYGLGHLRSTTCVDLDDDVAKVTVIFEECVSDRTAVAEYGIDPLAYGQKGGEPANGYLPNEPALSPIQIEALRKDDPTVVSHILDKGMSLSLTDEQMNGRNIVTFNLSESHTYTTDMDLKHVVSQVKFVANRIDYPEVSVVRLVPYFYDINNGILTMNEAPTLMRGSDELQVKVGNDIVIATMKEDGSILFKTA